MNLSQQIAALRGDLTRTILATMTGLVVFSLIISAVLLYQRAKANNGQDIQDLLNVTAEQSASGVESQLNAAMDVARAIGAALEGLRSAGVKDRASYDAVLRQMLENHPALLGAWAGFEPNVIDGRDADYVGKTGHDTTGRYVPYWNRGSGKIIVEPLLDYDKPGAGDYYQIPFTTGKPAALEPYLYTVAGKEVLMTSLVLPIKVGGKIIGVAGVDLALEGVQKTLAQQKPLDVGTVNLFSAKGLVVAHSMTQFLGKEGTNVGLSPAATDAIAKVKNLVETQGNHTILTAPVHINGVAEAWGVQVEVPTSRVTRSADLLLRDSAIFTVLIGLVAAGLAAWLGRALSQPLRQLIQVMSAAIAGRVDMPVPYRQVGGEIGAIAQAVQALQDSVRERDRLAGQAEAASRNAEAERQRQFAALADLFESKVAASMRHTQDAAGQLQSAAQELSSLSATTGQHIGIVEQSSGAAVNNARQVGSEAQQMVQIIAGVADRATRSVQIAAQAEEALHSTDATVRSLVEAAATIGEVVKLINDIASQTNLLALNATIEAARAGDAGKGFAVVATEVKSLANQTAQATEDISRQVARIQSTSNQAAQAIDSVSGIVRSINGMVDDISRAVGDQRTAADRISSAASQANTATDRVSSGVSDVSGAVRQSIDATQGMQTAVERMQGSAGELRQQIAEFLDRVRSAA